MVEVRNTKDYDRSISILVMGRCGVGKTVFATSSARRIIVLDIDGGLTPVRKNIDYIPVKSYRDYLEAVAFLQSAEGRAYDIAVLDSWTFLGNLVEKSVLTEVKREFLKGFDNWSLFKSRMRDCMTFFRELPMITVGTSLVALKEIEIGVRNEIVPDIQSDLKFEVGAIFQGVFYLDIVTNLQGKKERSLITAATGVVAAKDRFGKLPPVITGKDVNLDFVLNCLEKEV